MVTFSPFSSPRWGRAADSAGRAVPCTLEWSHRLHLASHQVLLTCLAHQAARHRSPPLVVSLPGKSSGTQEAADWSASLAKSAEYYSQRMDCTDRTPS